MDIYSTDEEKIESIKKWWKENGRSVIAGVAIGLGGVLAWQAWTGHTANVGERASVQFEQLLQTVEAGQADSADKQAELLMSEFESTTYAVFAAMSDARVKLEQGEGVAVRARLEWVLANAGDSALREIARLRLARFLLNEGNLDEASRLVAAAELESYAGEFAELEGDIAAAREDNIGAAAAYRRALQNNPGKASLVQMKLDDLAVDDSGGQSSSS